MADQVVNTPAAPAAPAAASAAPAAAAPAPAAPVSESAPAAPVTPAAGPSPGANPPAATPGDSAAPPAEAAKAAPAADAPKGDVSVLGGELPKTPDPAKAAEPPKTDEAKPADKAPEGEKKEAAPAELPKYEAFTLPEGIQADQEGIDAFTRVLGGFQNTTKADQKQVQAFGQELVNMQVQRETALVQRIEKANIDFFNKQTAAWKTEFEKDPEIGGNRMETTALAAMRAVREGASRSTDTAIAEKQTNDLLHVLNATGMGNHPALIRTFANLHDIITGLRDKYEKESSTPLAGKPAAEKKTTYDKFYGKSSAAS